MALKKKFSHYFHSIRGQKTLVIVVFMSMPIFLLLVFTYLPLIKMIQFSFYDMKYIGEKTYVGFENYISVFQRDDIFEALKLSLFYMAGALVQMTLALLLATMFASGMRHTAFLKGCLFFPYLISGIAVGYIFKFFFAHGYVLDTLLGLIGFDLEKLPHWLSDIRWNNIMLAGVSVWKFTGQNTVMYTGAMMSVNNDSYEAAAIDGANAWKKFWYITVPEIKTVIVLTAILSIGGALSVFEPPYVITGGSFHTATYFLIMDRVAHVNQKVGLASAMAVVLLALIAYVSLLLKGISYYFMDEDESGCTFWERHFVHKRRNVE